MAHKTLINGTAYEITGGRCLVDGTGYSIKKGRTLVDGTGYDINFSSGVALADLAEGEVVYINENGSLVEFYVACHNYESDLNGKGRTLLVRKEVHSTGQWEEDTVNTYASSDFDTWLNGDYKSLLDADVQSAINATKFYYTIGGVSETLSILQRAVFALSITEFALSSTNIEVEGSALPIAEILRIVTLNGNATSQWTRSPYKPDVGTSAAIVNASGNTGGTSTHLTRGRRPCFTLPSDSLFDENMEFVSQETKTFICFTVGNLAYVAEQGMTWGEFIESDYNIAGFFASGGYLYASAGHYIFDNTAMPVYPNNPIVANMSYIIT